MFTYSKAVAREFESDVLVIGGGPAGFGAAVAAARNGASTILIERNAMLGGMATTGLVGPFMTCYDDDCTEQIVKGIFDELCLRAEAKGGAIHPSKVDGMTTYSSYYIRSHCHVTPYLSEILALTIPDIMEQKHFDDAICTFAYAVDIHDPNGNGGCGYFCSACHFDPAGRGHQGLMMEKQKRL